ncbi:small integral membrane protein 22 isoform X3 [Panthera tigris]|nr:small integral membrane protein 22 isoform X2 [Panthera leo]XP_042827519.1 small integral membrane protein 22 isoform X3 [Panthera tigris]
MYTKNRRLKGITPISWKKKLRQRRSRIVPQGHTRKAGAEMALAEDLEKELETTAQEVLGKLRSGQLFQSRWDTAAFIIFLIFLGTVLLLLLLVCIHCCCYSCCSRRTSRSQKEHRRGVDNLALEP